MSIDYYTGAAIAQGASDLVLTYRSCNKGSERDACVTGYFGGYQVSEIFSSYLIRDCLLYAVDGVQELLKFFSSDAYSLKVLLYSDEECSALMLSTRFPLLEIRRLDNEKFACQAGEGPKFALEALRFRLSYSDVEHVLNNVPLSSNDADMLRRFLPLLKLCTDEKKRLTSLIRADLLYF